MKKKIVTIFLFLFYSVKIALGQAGTEIFIFDLKLTKNKITISNPARVTNHPGYDSQPFFHPDKPIL